jgi:hypothetical protein
MATTTGDAYVYQVPVMTPWTSDSRGPPHLRAALHRATGPRTQRSRRSRAQWPKTGSWTRSRCRSRTTSRRTSCRRRCPPTDRSVRLPGCAEAKCETGKVTHEPVYWDHASLSVQVGLLDPAELPATGAGAVRTCSIRERGQPYDQRRQNAPSGNSKRFVTATPDARKRPSLLRAPPAGRAQTTAIRTKRAHRGGPGRQPRLVPAAREGSRQARRVTSATFMGCRLGPRLAPCPGDRDGVSLEVMR